MPTLIDRLLGRTPQKASTGGTGAGVSAYYNDAPLWTTTNRSPRRLMRQAQELYHSHPWVHDAEFRISSTAAGVKWHLEDEDENEVDDTSPPELQAIRDLIEKPQENVDPRLKRFYRRSLWQLTFRHQGLCGNAFWYKDQRQGVTGIPAAFLYINPARMTPAYDKAGNTIGWKLDAEEDGSGGVPITLDEIVQFELDPPDVGAYGIGIVESAGMKVQLTTLADRHVGNVLASGGRLTGILAPKDPAFTASEDDWKSLVNDWRNIAEDPQAAKRLQIVKQPVDYTRTSATLTELQIEQVMKMGREDIFALWGIPLSQVGVQLPRSLNSGQTQSFEEATLWQGPIHSRLVPFKETIQYGILDEIARAGGPKLDLVLDEPEFDDDTPAYDKAQKAIDQPLTENERRSILKLDPLPDVDLKGEPLGVAIYRPANLILVSSGPDAAGNLIAPPAPPPPPPANPFGPNQPPFPPNPNQPPPFPLKARIDEPLRGLRRSLDTRWTPAARKSVSAFLRSQASDVAGRIRKNGAHLVAKPKDKALWWDPKAVDAALAKVLLPHATGIALQVAKRAQQTLARPAKADTFAETVAQFVRDRAGTRITKINETTRDDIAALIAQGFDEGLSPAEIADLIEGATAFDDARAELIARTESALAYNEAALSSYTEFGVSEVQASDGDQDEACAERDGQIFSVDEAMSIEDHPNGTLDWSPVVGEPVGKAELEHQLAMKAIDLDIARAAQPTITVNTPDVHVAPPSVNVAAPNVVVDTRQFAEAIDDLRTMLNKPKTRRVERDENGRAIAVHEE